MCPPAVNRRLRWDNQGHLTLAVLLARHLFRWILSDRWQLRAWLPLPSSPPAQKDFGLQNWPQMSFRFAPHDNKMRNITYVAQLYIAHSFDNCAIS